MDIVDCVIIGAGVTGLALARALSPSRSVVVLEQENRIGAHLSSRNSEVIHAGLYYPADSLKARLCLQGSKTLYRYCETTEVPFQRCGKLLVAQAGQETQLETLRRNAAVNGVEGLAWLPRSQWQQREPWLQAGEVLFSPDSGIIDSHALMIQLQQDAEQNGTIVSLQHRVAKVHCEPHRFILTVIDSNGQLFQLRTQQLILATGLFSVKLLERCDGFPSEQIPESRQARGNYFSLAGRSPTQRLVYPMPEAHGLGIHLTVDLAGQARFGPDVEWIDPALPPDYRVNTTRKSEFIKAIRQYWPEVNENKLQPAYAGIRPKLYQHGQPLTDFLIQDENDHGLAGMINLLGIESPGLTAALAIADEVGKRLD